MVQISALAAVWPVLGTTQATKAPLRKIATEEEFTIPEMTEPIREVLRRGGSSLDLKLLNVIYNAAPATLTQAGGACRRQS